VLSHTPFIDAHRRWRRYIYADDVKGGRTDKTVTRHSGQWKKGQSGNPAGPPKGTRHKATIAAEALLDGEVEALTRTAIERALEGDGVAPSPDEAGTVATVMEAHRKAIEMAEFEERLRKLKRG
jgi:Family of unknown function (DUF5681)